MIWQLLVVDGADREQVFPLPEKGVVVIGGSKKHADICLHDLYVQRTHCEIEVSDGASVLVRNLRPTEGIFVNKARTEQQQLNPGDVLRVGNTHLRLQPASEAPSKPEPEAEEEPETIEEVVSAGPGPLPTLPADRLIELCGHVLGHFQLDELLGQTAHKAVFLATDQKSEETVVLKVLSPIFPSRIEELQRFTQVMRKALHHQHDALVSLRGVGKNGPYTWMAREYIPGDSLDNILERITGGSKKLKWQSGIRLARQIGSALDYLHEQHIRHGHLTPHNIIVNIEAKEAKLANLLLNQALSGSQLGTAMRASWRTRDVYWFSPEQCEQGAFIDDLADQYALGALVYTRMTGKPPFIGSTPEETMKMIRTAKLVRPSELNPNIPRAVDAVVMRMLARQQQDRYLTPAELLADLDALDVS